MENKYKTDNKFLVFIGTANDEEYYLELKDDVRGGSFMGLRAETEETLRANARDLDPEEMLGLSREEFERISPYFDYEKFDDEMEDDWENMFRHDTQATREENGETYYLGFGSGTDIFRYFENDNINNFEDYKKHFDEIGLDEKTFNEVLKLVKEGQKIVGFPTDERKNEELETFKKILL